MSNTSNLETNLILDGLGHAVLIFDSAGNLVHDNLAARTLLALDIKRVRDDGWSILPMVFDLDPSADDLDTVRKNAMTAERPIRFHVLRSGEFIPAWATALTTMSGDVQIMITLELVDWSIVGSVIDRFRDEIQDAVDSTIGHVKLINKTIDSTDKSESVEVLTKRLGGFMRLIEVHMVRSGRLMNMMKRLEDIRTGAMRKAAREERRKINIEDFVEDFLEEIEEIQLLDPDTKEHDYRGRIEMDVQSGAIVWASRRYLTYALQDIVRNAIMYSPIETPVRINVITQKNNVQIDIVDEGSGIREKEFDRVFEAFLRARQPQIISEFGYGLSLHLCKQEVEGMNGGLWFQTEEKVGSTFSIRLPIWREEDDSSSTMEA